MSYNAEKKPTCLEEIDTEIIFQSIQEIIERMFFSMINEGFKILEVEKCFFFRGELLLLNFGEVYTWL